MKKQVVVGSISKDNPKKYNDAGSLHVNVVSYGRNKNVSKVSRELVKGKKRFINYAVDKKVTCLPENEHIGCPPSEEYVKVLKPLICPCPKEGCCDEEKH